MLHVDFLALNLLSFLKALSGNRVQIDIVSDMNFRAHVYTSFLYAVIDSFMSKSANRQPLIPIRVVTCFTLFAPLFADLTSSPEIL